MDNMGKENKVIEHTEDDYKSLESKYNDEISKREKLESDYQNLYQKYKDRFTDSVSNFRREEPKEEPIEEKVLDIRSIF